MRILVVNPNTTIPMTDKIAKASRAVARPDTEIIATNPVNGPTSIQGFYDVAICIPGLLEEIGRHDQIGGYATPVGTALLQRSEISRGSPFPMVLVMRLVRTRAGRVRSFC